MSALDELRPGMGGNEPKAAEPAARATGRRQYRRAAQAAAAEPARAGTALSTDDIAAIAAQVAQIIVQMPGNKPSMVVPPRVGTAAPPDDDDENEDPLSARAQNAAKARLGIRTGPSAAAPRAQGLSDEEVLAMFQEEELGEFDVPDEVKMPGMAYGWKLHTALGKGDSGYEAELRRRGWISVLHEDHPGAFGLRGETGPVMRKGLQLMRRVAEQEELRQRYWRLVAKQAVRDKVAQMSAAPPGTGPRTHEKVRPQITRTYEPLPVE